jgi:type IV secretion system protein VirB9
VGALVVTWLSAGGLALAQTPLPGAAAATRPPSITAAPRASTTAAPRASTTAVPRGVRTIPYHARDLVALRAKVRYTTMIVLPEAEDILEVTCGDKEFWIVNAHGAVAYVKPAKPGSETNLNLRTASGQVYPFVLSEISELKGAEPDLAVYLEPEDPASFAPWHEPPKYVPAQQLADVRAQAEIARDEARRATEAARKELEHGVTVFRTTYPLSLQFDYRIALDRAPFFVRGMFHDEHVTYIQAHAPELPSLYELKDGTANLVNFEVHDGTYVVQKVLDNGYFALGKQRLMFTRPVVASAR